MRALQRRVVEWATARTVLGALAAYLVSLVALTVSDAHVASFAPLFDKPDLRFGYGHADVVAAFAMLGEGGRRAYGLNLVVDTIMPVAFAAAAILAAARAAPRLLAVLAVAPLLFLVLDVVENAAFGAMLLQFPDVSAALVAATSPVTIVKLCSFFVALPTLVVAVLTIGVRWAWRRRAALRHP
jgi:hypothetical protein